MSWCSATRCHNKRLTVLHRREKTVRGDRRENSNETWNYLWSFEKARLFTGQSG